MPAWTIATDDSGAHTVCPHCRATDRIVERDRAERGNTLTLSADGMTATASVGAGDWETDGYHCRECGGEVTPPDGFEIVDWS